MWLISKRLKTNSSASFSLYHPLSLSLCFSWPSFSLPITVHTWRNSDLLLILVMLWFEWLPSDFCIMSIATTRASWHAFQVCVLYIWIVLNEKIPSISVYFEPLLSTIFNDFGLAFNNKQADSIDFPRIQFSDFDFPWEFNRILDLLCANFGLVFSFN